MFSDSNDLNCQNKTFMCTVKEHRHVSQQNRITSKTNKIPLNLCSYNSINSIFKLMSTFFTRIIGLLQCIFKKKTFEGSWLSTTFKGKTEEVKN